MQRCAKINPTEDSHRDSQLCVQVAAVKRSLETKVLPKHHPPESILQPISRLPADVFVLIPHFFTREVERQQFAPPPTKLSEPLITITHVCRSRGGAWRSVLLSAPSLWTQIDFSVLAKSQQAEVFIRRSGNQLLSIYQDLTFQDDIEPFLSITLTTRFASKGCRLSRTFLTLSPC